MSELRRGIATPEAFAESLREKGAPVAYHATAETMREAFSTIAESEITFKATDETVSTSVINKDVAEGIELYIDETDLGLSTDENDTENGVEDSTETYTQDETTNETGSEIDGETDVNSVVYSSEDENNGESETPAE